MSEWRATTLGEVAQVVGGGTPSTKQAHYWGGDILWLTPGELTKREGRVITSTERMISSDGLTHSSAKMLPADAVLLTSRATVGAVGLAGQPMATNQGFQSLVAGPDVIPRFLMYWAQENRSEFESRASGSTFPEISGKKVKAVPVGLPPLDEQRRIVDVVTAVDAQTEALEAEVESAATVHGAVSEKVLFEKDWPTVAVGDLAVEKGLIGGPFGSSLVSKDYRTSGVPVIRGTNMNSAGRFIGGEFAFVSPEKADSLKNNLAAPGDVVFTQRGTLGQVSLVPAGEHERFVVSQSQMRLRTSDDVSAGYVFHAFSTTRMVSVVKEQNTATANPHINLGILSRITLPLPPREVQDEVVAYLDASLGTLESMTFELGFLRTLRSTLLTALLSQSISVPESYDAVFDLPAGGTA